MMRLSCVLLVGLAGCGGVARALPQEPGPDAAFCRDDARQRVAQRNYGRELNAENLQNLARVQEEERIALLRAYRDCMRRRGASIGGGVEPIRRQ